MRYEPVGDLVSSPVIIRHPRNPVLSRADVPYESSLVYNAGITKFQDMYVMVFRNDIHETWGTPSNKGMNLGLAFSKDGVQWDVRPEPCFSHTNLNPDELVKRVYDPRLTVIDGRCYMCFAAEGFHGIRGGIAVTDDFERWEILHCTVPDNRNMVLFPERINGKYTRLERPFPVYSRNYGPGPFLTRFDLWLSASPDCRFWGECALVLGVEHVPFANDKIGPGAPPVKTEKGWLTTFHAVDIDESRKKNGWEETWKKRYCAGIMLLDLNDPRKVIGMSRRPLIAPEAPYEVDGGIRNNVIFPGGMILEPSGEVKIFYGAADTVECLAAAPVEDLIALCEPVTLEHVV